MSVAANADRIGYGVAAATGAGAAAYATVAATNRALQMQSDVQRAMEDAAKALADGMARLPGLMPTLPQEEYEHFKTELHALEAGAKARVNALEAGAKARVGGAVEGVLPVVEGVLSAVLVGGVLYLAFKTWRYVHS